MLDDGRIAYRVKYSRDARGSLRIMSPMDFMARLSALIPPPRYPLVRYFGVLAPNSKWRKLVVPKPRSASRAHGHGSASAKRDGEEGQATAKAPHAGNGTMVAPAILSSAMPPILGPSTVAPVPAIMLPVPPMAPAMMSAPMLPGTMSMRSGAPVPSKEGVSATGAESPSVIRLGPNMISIKHWERLENGALLATSPRIDWARLLKRGLDVDALECPKCRSRLRVMAVIIERETAKKICEHIGLPGRAPARARARGPGEEDGQLSMGW